MNNDIDVADATMTDEPDHADDDAFRLLLNPGDEHAAPGIYPRLWNMSAAFMVKAVARAENPTRPEYVPVPVRPGFWDEANLWLSCAISKWNLLWEAAQFRRRFFDDDELPPPLYKIADQGDVNVIFVPRTESRYYEYAPLFHLLPRAALQRHGLPLLRRGHWPYLQQLEYIDDHLPIDFRDRLARAWAGTVWRHLMPQPRSGIAKFTTDDPIRILAHHLDFWLPPVTQVLQDYLREFPVVESDVAPGPVPLVDGSILPGVTAAGPRMGGDIWCGEEEAAEAVRRTVEAADATGRLRGILDAVRSHRCEDDFSPHWSGAREDFERKLYHKRSRVQVRSGFTKLTEVAETMGYRTHSAVSKRLDHILRQASRLGLTVRG